MIHVFCTMSDLSRKKKLARNSSPGSQCAQCPCCAVGCLAGKTRHGRAAFGRGAVRRRSAVHTHWCVPAMLARSFGRWSASQLGRRERSRTWSPHGSVYPTCVARSHFRPYGWSPGVVHVAMIRKATCSDEAFLSAAQHDHARKPDCILRM
jgi:hypothetical protein